MKRMILWLQAVLFCALTLQCSDDKNGESYTFRLSISDWPITPGSLSQRVDIEAPDRWSALVDRRARVRAGRTQLVHPESENQPVARCP